MKTTAVLFTIITVLACASNAPLPGETQEPSGVTASTECDCSTEQALDAGVDAVDASTTGAEDAGPPPAAVRSGTRLKVRYVSSDDGLRVPLPDTFFDSQLEAACSLHRSKVPYRCEPEAVEIEWSGYRFFADSTCTERLVVHPGRPNFAVDGPSFFTVLDEYTSTGYRSGTNISCEPCGNTCVTILDKFFRVGDDITDTLVTLRETVGDE